jgi:hypothetical protein
MAAARKSKQIVSEPEPAAEVAAPEPQAEPEPQPEPLLFIMPVRTARERFAELSICPAGREAEFARWLRPASHPEIVALRKLRGL